MPTSDSNDLAPATWATFSDDEWSVMADAVPEIGEYRETALRAGQSPTAAIWSTWVTIGAALPQMPAQNVRNFRRGGKGEEPLEFGYEFPFVPQQVSRLVSLFGKAPQPLTGYLAVLAPPGMGKSEAVHWGSPFLPGRQEFITACSGQSFATRLNKNSVKVYPKTRNKEGDIVDDMSEPPALELLESNYVAYYDEASEFDKLLNGSGANLPATFNKAFFGSPAKLAQAAATDDANRAVPGANQSIAVGLVMCAQPGTLRDVVKDRNGFAERLWWCAMSGGETSDELPEFEVKRWFSDWSIKYTKGFTVGVDPRVREYLSAVTLLVRMRYEEDHPKFHERYEKVCELASEKAAVWWLTSGGDHGVARVSRLSAQIALMSKRTDVSPADLRAAMVAAMYSARTFDQYRSWMKVFGQVADASNLTEKALAKALSEGQVASEVDAIRQMKNEIAFRVESGVRSVGSADRRIIGSWFGPSVRRKHAALAGVSVPVVVEDLVKGGRLVQIEGSNMLRLATDAERGVTTQERVSA